MMVSEVRKTEHKTLVMFVFEAKRASDWDWTETDVVEATGLSYDEVREALWSLVREDKVNEMLDEPPHGEARKLYWLDEDKAQVA